MNTRTELWMRAPAQTIYGLASQVVRWPEWLPHYRWLTLLEQQGDRVLVQMAARRGAIPVSWQAVCELFPHEPRMTFRHVRGITRGMEVTWSFREQGGGTLVRIDHELQLVWPLIGEWAASSVIGPHFVEYIARRTLRCFRRLAEAAREA